MISSSIKTRLDNLSSGSNAKLSKVPVSIEDAEKLFKKSKTAFKYGNQVFEYSRQKRNEDFNERIFLDFYDSYRITLDILIRLSGYKTKTSGGSHYLTIQFGEDILKHIYKNDNKISDKLNAIFLRFKQINTKRANAAYAPDTIDFSFSELNQIKEDLVLIHVLVGKIINSRK